MLNDNAPALSQDISTTDTPIQDSSVKWQIDMQESLIMGSITVEHFSRHSNGPPHWK